MWPDRAAGADLNDALAAINELGALGADAAGAGEQARRVGGARVGLQGREESGRGGRNEEAGHEHSGGQVGGAAVAVSLSSAQQPLASVERVCGHRPEQLPAQHAQVRHGQVARAVPPHQNTNVPALLFFDTFLGPNLRKE